MTDPVDWDLARRVAGRVAGRAGPGPVDPTLDPQFAELTAEAEDLVAASTGLRSAAGPARARVASRTGWVDANIASFQRLLRPLTDKLGSKLTPGFGADLARRLTGIEVGVLLGWMSTRVLGQYDLLVVEEENPHEQDLVYYVGPNVVSLERRFAFPPREFRLWLALHEVTHRAQFTGVPWLRGYFLGLVHQTLDSVEPDPQRMLHALRRVADGARSGRSALDDGGLVGLFATPSQRDLLDRIGGLMSLLEGHGDRTMAQASVGRIPSAPRFARVLHARRTSAKGPTKLFSKLVGLDAKLAQYEQGERFLDAVDAAGGESLVNRVWEGPELLPTLAEIRDPAAWIARARLPEAVAP